MKRYDLHAIRNAEHSCIRPFPSTTRYAQSLHWVECGGKPYLSPVLASQQAQRYRERDPRQYRKLAAIAAAIALVVLALAVWL